MIKRSFAAALLLAVVSLPAQAATLVQTNFSAAIFGGNANVRNPLLDPFFPNDTFTGSFVFDADLVPGAGSGFANVALGSNGVPASDAFVFNFGDFLFTLADDPAAMVQYNNGNFNGLVFNSTFTFEGQNYLFSLSGGTLKVVSEAEPFGQPYINGYVNIGNQALTGSTPYAPVNNAVPEPAAWAMMLVGFGLIGGTMRSAKRRSKLAVSFG